MDEMTITPDIFQKDWLAYRIQQDAAGWRWSCSLLGKDFASGTEPSEERAVQMAQTVRNARFSAEIHALRPSDWNERETLGPPM